MFLYVIVVGFGVLNAVLAAGWALSLDRFLRWTSAIAVAGLAALMTLALVRTQVTPLDFGIFRAVGRDVCAGLDPYTPGRFEGHLFFNPPSSLPLFALFWLAPEPVADAIWSIFNAVAAVLLVPAAYRAIRSQSTLDPVGRTPSVDLPPAVLLSLTAAVALSNAAMRNATLGQLGVLAALLILVALGDQGRGKPIRAGLALALATVKVGTVVPILLLFFARRSDWRTWVASGLGVALLCAIPGHPERFPVECRELLAHIGHFSSPGLQNDYAEGGTDSHSILGFDHALYRLGHWDRSTIRVAQALLLAALGGGLAIEAARRKLPRAALCSLTSLYAVIFLYHRVYDTALLALPLAFAAGRARAERGGKRGLYAVAAISCLLIINLRSNAIKFFEQKVAFGGPIRGIVLSYATWLVLLAMACLWIASARRPPAEPELGAVPPGPKPEPSPEG